MTATEQTKIIATLDLADEVLAVAADRVKADPCSSTTTEQQASAAVQVAMALLNVACARDTIDRR